MLLSFSMRLLCCPVSAPILLRHPLLFRSTQDAYPHIRRSTRLVAPLQHGILCVVVGHVQYPKSPPVVDDDSYDISLTSSARRRPYFLANRLVLAVPVRFLQSRSFLALPMQRPSPPWR